MFSIEKSSSFLFQALCYAIKPERNQVKVDNTSEVVITKWHHWVAKSTNQNLDLWRLIRIVGDDQKDLWRPIKTVKHFVYILILPYLLPIQATHNNIALFILSFLSAAIFTEIVVVWLWWSQTQFPCSYSHGTILSSSSSLSWSWDENLLLLFVCCYYCCKPSFELSCCLQLLLHIF